MRRVAMLARGLRLQPRALILLVPPHPITAAARPVAVLLALQIAVDGGAAHAAVAVDLVGEGGRGALRDIGSLADDLAGV